MSYPIRGVAGWVDGECHGDCPPNRRPVAVADSVTVKNGRTYRIPVLANDTDPDGDRVRLVKVGKATHGKAKKSGSKVVYTAPKSWTGTLKVTYTIKDEHGARDKAVLRIVVEKRGRTPKPTQAPRGEAGCGGGVARLGLPTGSVTAPTTHAPAGRCVRGAR